MGLHHDIYKGQVGLAPPDQKREGYVHVHQAAHTQHGVSRWIARHFNSLPAPTFKIRNQNSQ